ncbi:hypothetical protein [Ideonella sp.]|uniref:hypothetical protein n=1 Tax=Ideonella sp. TaxID=1929293 RepID=UPI002B49BD69|nr:hypothetical protein [Ideonella sp.]HJV68376.1 hypothetical protein [Ideonella sp.]
MSSIATAASLEQLNDDCFCFSLDREALAHALDAELGEPGLSALMHERCPSVFAAQPVFVASSQLQRMAQVVRAVEAVVALPAYREQVLAGAPATARVGTAAGPRGVFLGYDFHLDHGRLGLIEINTNAGGAMLNAVLARAQRSCCAAMDTLVPTRAHVAAFEQRLVDMFRREWRLAGHTRPLRSIAIVDEKPERQYLYPEFLLFRRLFERHGLTALIADPAELQWRDGALWLGESAIDLVYNRLTDFYLEQPASAALRDAWLHQGVVLTPHPQAHALYADKRQLALFCDAARLQALGVPDPLQRVLLESVPHTEIVTAANSERLWSARRGLFFKPVAGFGSRAAYRGDKLTHRVWQEILAGDYVAQAIVSPGTRRIDEGDGVPPLKFDLRAYAYGGDVQWVAARLYQGQTTNFRTPGGGFAPVFSTVDASGRARAPASAEHASYVFLLDEAGGVHPVPHALYVALARRESTAPMLAGQTLRLADWYVRLKDGEPQAVVNETYSVVQVDARGQVESIAAPADAGWPTVPERERMHATLFDVAESAT